MERLYRRTFWRNINETILMYPEQGIPLKTKEEVIYARKLAKNKLVGPYNISSDIIKVTN